MLTNKKINLLVDCHFFDYNFIHGARTYLKGLYSELIKIDNELFHFYFVSADPEKLKIEFGIHSNVTYVKFKSSNKFYRLTFDFQNIIKKYKIDYLHVQYISPLKKTCKEIVTTHDVLFNDFPQFFSLSYKYVSNYLFSRSAQRADLLLTVSQYSKNSISKHYNIPLDKIKITPNAASNDFIEILKTNKLPDIKSKYNLDKYIIYVSRFEPRKNHLLLLKAYLALKLWESNVYLVFIGKISATSKEYTSYYNSLPEDLKKSIKHIEQVSNEDLVALIKNAKLFVYPSLAEGFGIPPLEAAILGVPCLCSNVTAMKDFSFFGDRLFNPKDQEELQNKMKLILSVGDQTENERIQKFVAKNYQWRNIANNFYSLLKKLVIT